VIIPCTFTPGVEVQSPSSQVKRRLLKVVIGLAQTSFTLSFYPAETIEVRPVDDVLVKHTVEVIPLS